MNPILSSRRSAHPRISLVALSIGALFTPAAFAAGVVIADAPIFLGPSSGSASSATGISADGSAVIGTATVLTDTQAFRWTTATGMQNLGTLGGRFSDVTSVSADGNVVVGRSTTASNGSVVAFRWTTAAGMQSLGTLGGVSSDATAVSADGAVIVGSSYPAAIGNTHAFRWTAAGGMADLGTLGGNNSSASAVSADGGVVVGEASTSGNVLRAFRWTAATAMQDLGALDGGSSSASAVSADGAVVAGKANTISNATRVFRWTSATGMKDIGTFGGDTAYFYGMSADGSVFVGAAAMPGNTAVHAFRWTGATGMADLGTLGGPQSLASAVNASGSVIVGLAQTSNSDLRVFRWTRATGMQDLQTLLANAGVRMSGITLSSVSGLSSNGQYIVGSGSGPATNGIGQAYLIRYIDATVLPPPATEPATPQNPAASTPSPGSPSPAAPVLPVIAGVTTPASVQASANQVGKGRQSVMGQMHGFADQMLGEGAPSGAPSGVSAFGSVGSLAAGITGHLNLAPFELVAGLGYASESYSDTEMKGAFTAAAKLRYAYMLDDRIGWFGEAGGFYSPDSNYRFSRNYANGSGTATGSGSASGRQAYGFARLGMLINVTANDQLTQSLEIGRQVLHTGSYSEVLSPANPFEASMPASSSTMNVLKLREKWVHAFTSTIDAAIWGAWAHGFSYRDGSQLNVGGVGALSPQVSNRLNWVEYGARVGYRVNRKAKVSAFVNGVAGADVGARTHVGLNLEMFF
ncbi:HAF family extracellular repeat-containing protein [Pandoraea communis]|uniref:HAF family extracellular repeat-containing protein n=1 Tax=Pandoraea communis TaxID=2508297 RepID=A0A5E4WZ77_9BURK|nr:hypothetical protein [Pandoraea communis]VVE28686.1 HAF family extracellular repeat-containing protein [Pandoraea communis]